MAMMDAPAGGLAALEVDLETEMVNWADPDSLPDLQPDDLNVQLAAKKDLEAFCSRFKYCTKRNLNRVTKPGPHHP